MLVGPWQIYGTLYVTGISLGLLVAVESEILIPQFVQEPATEGLPTLICTVWEAPWARAWGAPTTLHQTSAPVLLQVQFKVEPAAPLLVMVKFWSAGVAPPWTVALKVKDEGETEIWGLGVVQSLLVLQELVQAEEVFDTLVQALPLQAK